MVDSKVQEEGEQEVEKDEKKNKMAKYRREKGSCLKHNDRKGWEYWENERNKQKMNGNRTTRRKLRKRRRMSKRRDEMV